MESVVFDDELIIEATTLVATYEYQKLQLLMKKCVN